MKEVLNQLQVVPEKEEENLGVAEKLWAAGPWRSSWELLVSIGVGIPGQGDYTVSGTWKGPPYPK